LNTVRKIFLALFVVSTLGVLMLFVNLQSLTTTPAPSSTQDPGIVPTPSPNNPDTDPSSQSSKGIAFAALIGSVITSVTSLIGFVTTTVITWRREKREASLADVQRKKLETELEKSKLELERLKKSRTKKRKK